MDYEDIIQQIVEEECVTWREAELLYADRLSDFCDQQADR
jgi:transcriptional regulator CtsR